MSINLEDDVEKNQQDEEAAGEKKSSRKAKNEEKKAHERAVHSKLSRLLEKKRLRSEFDSIDGWL